jgi:hypothetical protein
MAEYHLDISKGALLTVEMLTNTIVRKLFLDCVARSRYYKNILIERY